MVSNGVVESTPYLVYVDPFRYGNRDNHFKIARSLGKVNERLKGTRYVLIGPGRWGSVNPDLGVPVDYAELCNCGCMVELGIVEKHFTPELSYGTHFFLDLDVDNILYLPVFAGKDPISSTGIGSITRPLNRVPKKRSGFTRGISRCFSTGRPKKELLLRIKKRGAQAPLFQSILKARSP